MELSFNRKRKLWIRATITTLLLLIILPLSCYYSVVYMASDRIYEDIKSIPYNDVGLLLGTGPQTRTGKPNSYFQHRIDAAETLYKASKIKYILISGDNSRKDYSEPDVMRDSLIARGIPAEIIYLDYAGFRTLDSVIRANRIFGQSKMTVISQRFHNERSIILGDWQGMELIGYNAKGTKSNAHKIRAHIREGYARIKLFIDIIINKKPHFLGYKIEIADGKPQVEVNGHAINNKEENERRRP